MMSFLVSMLKKAWVLYVVALLVFYKGTDLYLMKVKTINHVVPQSMSDQAAFMFRPHFNGTNVLKQAIEYHKTVVKLVPNSWADWSFLGYAYFFEGDWRRARICLERSYAHEEKFFWYAYDLGMIHLREGHYEQAGKYFTKAVSADFPKTLYLMHAYKAYNLLMPEVLKTGYDVELSLFNAVKNAQAMLLICQIKAPIDPKDPKFFPRLF